MLLIEIKHLIKVNVQLIRNFLMLLEIFIHY